MNRDLRIERTKDGELVIMTATEPESGRRNFNLIGQFSMWVASDGSPDFVVELRSPSDDLDELHAKLVEYQENGASLGWLLDPDTRDVWIYRPGAAPEHLVRLSNLHGAPLLPGFVLDLSKIW